MFDFINENNLCGHNILRLVSRGNAIIAEILRLKEYVPPCFRLNNKADQQKYGEILLDFSFLGKLEAFEKKLESNQALRDLDDELRENYLEIVTRYYLLFESIYKYILDLNRFIQDLEDGLYIQQTLETVFVSEEGKQLMCEALYICGAILLFVDLHIEGPVRERLLVSYFRYSAQRTSTDCYVDEVCQLLRSTEFNPQSSRRPPSYPVDYFKRAGIKEIYISMVAGRLRADDLYHQLKVFPLPEHRSTALASQAAMLFVVLFFQPETLNSQPAVMREIVDKYFPDNWVISIYMGEVVNLVSAWESFRAAKNALSNTLVPANVDAASTRAATQIQKLLVNVRKLNDDAVTDRQLLDNSRKVLNLVREANVTLRWLLLHTGQPLRSIEPHKKCRQLREQVTSITKNSAPDIFHLLLNTAEFELRVRETFKMLLTEKPEKWKQDKKECVERLVELADVFSGEKPLTRLEKNDKLQAWFKDIAKQIESLDFEQANATGRKIVHLIQALEEVQEFHGLSTHGQAMQVLTETRDILHGLLRSAGLHEEISIQLQAIADMSYAWLLLDSYASYMRDGIKKDTGLVVKLRATFLKMATGLEVPLLRINQARSPDLISVSQYYSSELVAFLRRVLHIIPETMFEIMATIAVLQTDGIKEVPTRLDKDDVRDYAQLDKRFQVAKLTNDVSMLTEGITLLQSTLVGVIKIDPIELLEDGIRCELVRHVATALNAGLSKFKGSSLEQKLERLGEVMDGQKRSFEYIQDYIHIYGLKIWQEELTRVIGYYVEQECNNFLRNKVSDSESLYQSKAIPIPNFTTTDQTDHNCIGRLVDQIIRITDARSAVHSEHNMSWFDLKERKEVLGLRFFGKVSRALGIPGLAGVDKLLSFMIASELRNLVTVIQRGPLKEQESQALLGEVSKQLSASPLLGNPVKVYSNQISRTNKLWSPLLEPVIKIGQMQLLRVHIAYELNTSCQFESPHLAAALEAFNSSVLSDTKKHYKDGTNPHPDEEVLYDLACQLDCVGLGDPARKIYLTTRNLRYFPLISFLFTLSNLPKLTFLDSHGGFSKKSSDRIDGASFIMGLHTLFWQFHPETRTQFYTYMAQFIKSRMIDINWTKGEQTDEAIALNLMEKLMRLSLLPKCSLEDYLPQVVVDFNSP